MVEDKALHEFPVQLKNGSIYQVTVKSIKAEAGDRYGWKKDRLVAWLEFEPNVGSVISTFADIPIREYTREELVATLLHVGQETIVRLLDEQKREKQERDVQEENKVRLDAFAGKVSSLLEVKRDKTG